MVALGRVRVVLPNQSPRQHRGPAMETMGLSQLVLVDPQSFPDPVATARAAGADDILASARVVATLAEALEGTVFAVPTARKREMAVPMMWAREAAGEIVGRAAFGDVAGLRQRDQGPLQRRRGPLPHARQDSGERGVFVPQPRGGGAGAALRAAHGGPDPVRRPASSSSPPPTSRSRAFTPTPGPGDHRQRFLQPRQLQAAVAAPATPVRPHPPRDDEVNILRGMLSAFEKKRLKILGGPAQGVSGRRADISNPVSGAPLMFSRLREDVANVLQHDPAARSRWKCSPAIRACTPCGCTVLPTLPGGAGSAG